MRLGSTHAMYGAIGLVAACHATNPLGDVPANSLAREAGVHTYQIIHADAHVIDVVLVGERGGRLAIHAIPNHVEQHLVRAEGTFDLVTDDNAIRMNGTPADLALVLAVDIDLAVQGTSLVNEARAYVPCTLECTNAAHCATRWTDEEATCTPHVVTCTACLEQEP